MVEQFDLTKLKQLLKDFTTWLYDCCTCEKTKTRGYDFVVPIEMYNEESPWIHIEYNPETQLYQIHDCGLILAHSDMIDPIIRDTYQDLLKTLQNLYDFRIEQSKIIIDTEECELNYKILAMIGAQLSVMNLLFFYYHKSPI